jgi:hypothetical protein
MHVDRVDAYGRMSGAAIAPALGGGRNFFIFNRVRELLVMTSNSLTLLKIKKLPLSLRRSGLALIFLFHSASDRRRLCLVDLR